MGKGICADCYVGKPDAQYWFRNTFGGNPESPHYTQRRLDADKLRKKNNRSPRPRTERKTYE